MLHSFYFHVGYSFPLLCFAGPGMMGETYPIPMRKIGIGWPSLLLLFTLDSKGKKNQGGMCALPISPFNVHAVHTHQKLGFFATIGNVLASLDHTIPPQWWTASRLTPPPPPKPLGAPNCSLNTTSQQVKSTCTMNTPGANFF